MKTKFFSKLTIASMLTSFITPLAVLVPQAAAVTDTCTWTGGVDNTFNDSGNWNCSIDGAAVPENGDTLQFDMSVATMSGEVLNNDIVGLDIAGLDLTGSNGSGYSFNIEGNDLTLSGNITGDQTDGSVTLLVNVIFGANVEYSVPNTGVYFSNSDNGGVYDLDLQTYNLTINDTSSCGVTIWNSLAGSGNILSNTGSSGITLRAAENGFTGDITTSGGGLAVVEGAVPSGSTVTINGSGQLRLIASNTASFPFDVTMNSDANPALLATVYQFGCSGGGLPEKTTTTLSGNLTLGADTVFYGENDLIVTGTYTDGGNSLSVYAGSTGSITTSAGNLETEKQTTVITADDKSSAYLSVVNKETTTLNGARGTVDVFFGGILMGTGEAESINVQSGGTLAPGLSPGCITVTSGGLTISGAYDVEIAGTTACSGYDQTDVTGVVNLTGGTLDVSFLSDFTPAVNDAFMIIKNDAADDVIGTFTGLADGATFQVNGVTFQINYNGGDGNDVMLLVTAVVTPETPETGLQNLISNPLTTLLALLAAAGVLGGLRYAEKRK